MPASGSALAALIQSNVNSRMLAVKGHAPLSQKNPSYYIQFTTAIGIGIISGGPSIAFTTSDTGNAGSPLVPGVGNGVGIVTDPTFFVEDLYTRTRSYIIADFGKTLHEAYPPSSGNSGEYLLALCEGINDSILSYYPTGWTLVSANPEIYMGTGMIADGQFSGLSASAIQSSIVSAASSFTGVFWPRLAQAISESYVALIEQHATGMVTITGDCSPGPSQTCDISGSSGTGTGTAT